MWPFAELSGKEMVDMMNVNVVAPITCAKLAVHSMTERGIDDGHIFNINRFITNIHKSKISIISTNTFILITSLYDLFYFVVRSMLGHSVVGIMHFYSATKFALDAATQGTLTY